VENRKSNRSPIQVEIEIAHPVSGRCCGYAENISRTGVSVILTQGQLPTRQRTVILNFKIGKGSRVLYHKVYARVVRLGEDRVALEFARPDFATAAVIDDLMSCQRDSQHLMQYPLTA
jgi:hypothetical protein